MLTYLQEISHWSFSDNFKTKSNIPCVRILVVMTIANQFDHRLKQKYVIYKQQVSQSTNTYKILKQMEEVNALTK